MDLNIKEKSPTGIINLICALYIIFWVISPIAIGVDILRTIVIICACLWFISSVIISKSLFLKNTIISCLVYFCIAYVSIVSYMTNGSAGISANMNILIYLYIILFYLFYKDNCKNNLKVLFVFSLVLVAIFSTTTLIGNIGQQDPVSRFITGGKLNKDYYHSRGIGSYNFIFTVACFCPLIFYMLFDKQVILAFKNKDISQMVKYSLLLITFIIVCLMLFITKFSFALAATAIGIIIIVFSKFKLKTNLIIAGMLILGISVFIAFIYTGVIEVLPEEEWRANWSNLIFKAYSVMESIRSGNLTGAVAHRWMFYSYTLSVIPTHIWGGTVFDPSCTIGGHAFLMDNIAGFGIIIGSILDFLFIFVPISYIYKKDKGFNALALSLFLSVLFILLLDSLAHGISVVIFVCMIYLIEKNIKVHK